MLTTPQLSQHNASQKLLRVYNSTVCIGCESIVQCNCTTGLQKTYRTFTAKLAHRPIYLKSQGLRHCNINFFAKTAAQPYDDVMSFPSEQGKPFKKIPNGTMTG